MAHLRMVVDRARATHGEPIVVVGWNDGRSRRYVRVPSRCGSELPDAPRRVEIGPSLLRMPQHER
jgi:hypothetical protein